MWLITNDIKEWGNNSFFTLKINPLIQNGIVQRQIITMKGLEGSIQTLKFSLSKANISWTKIKVSFNLLKNSFHAIPTE